MTSMPHPPYLPNLTLSDFLFPWVKNVIEGNHFASMEEAKQKTVEELKGIKIDKLKTVLCSGKQYLDRCIASNGDYFEGD